MQTASSHRQTQHTPLARVYRAFSWCAESSLNQDRNSVNYERTVTAMARERQFQAAGALSPNPDHPTGADNWRERCMPGSKSRTTTTQTTGHTPSGADIQCRPVWWTSQKVGHTQQITQKQPMPIRVKAAPSSLRQAHHRTTLVDQRLGIETSLLQSRRSTTDV